MEELFPFNFPRKGDCFCYVVKVRLFKDKRGLKTGVLFAPNIYSPLIFTGSFLINCKITNSTICIKINRLTIN